MGTIKINPNNRIEPIVNEIDYAIEELNFKIDKLDKKNKKNRLIIAKRLQAMNKLTVGRRKYQY
jgi:ribosome maturation protein Sdo1